MPIIIHDIVNKNEKLYYPIYNSQTKTLNKDEFNWNSTIRIYDHTIGLDIACAIANKWFIEQSSSIIIISDESHLFNPQNFANWISAMTSTPSKIGLAINLGTWEFAQDIIKARDIPNAVNIQTGRMAALLGDNWDYKLRSYSNNISNNHLSYKLEDKSEKSVELYSIDHKHKLNLNLTY